MTTYGEPEEAKHAVIPPVFTIKNLLLSFLFLIPYFAVILIGGSSINIISDAHIKPNTIFIDSDALTDETYDGDKSGRFVLGALIINLMSCLWAVLQVLFTLYLGARTMTVIFVVFTLLAVFGGVIMFADEDDQLLGVILMLMAVMAVVFFFSLRHKLDFAKANLRVACAALLASPTALYLAGAVLVILFVWSIFWVFMVYGFATNDGQTGMTYQGVTYEFNECTSYLVEYHALSTFNSTADLPWPSQLEDCDDVLGCTSCFHAVIFIRDGVCFSPASSTLRVVLSLLIFYYVSLVLAHAVHSACAQVTVRWWMHGRAANAHSLAAYKQAVSRYLGPICLGTLLVPPIRTLYSTVYTIMILLDMDISTGRPRTSHPSPHLMKLGSHLHSLLSSLENYVVSFNRYAFSFLVMHDSQHDFVEASQGVADLFSARGFTSLVHDTVLENVVMIACTSSGVVGMLLATLYVSLAEDLRNDESNINRMLPVCCFITGYFTSLVMLQAIQGSASAVYVSLAENPDALQTHHPEYFEVFVAAWRKHYPEAHITIGASSSFTAGGGKSSVSGMFPAAYVPPAVPLKKMSTRSATHTPHTRAEKNVQKYEKLAGTEDENGSDEDMGGDSQDRGSGSRSGGGVIEVSNDRKAQQKLEDDLEAELESYTASQLPTPPSDELFLSPARLNNPELFDNDENDFVL